MANASIRLAIRRRKTSKQRPLTEIALNSTWDASPKIVADAVDTSGTADDWEIPDAQAFAELKLRLAWALDAIGAPFVLVDK